MKKDSQAFQTAKELVIGEKGPFSGWIRTGSEFQNFTWDEQVDQ